MNGRKPSLAIKEHFWLFTILFLLSINFSRETASAKKNKASTWNESILRCGKERINKNYKIFETCKETSYADDIRKVYVLRKKDKKSILVYKPVGQVNAIVGHRLKLILLNDYMRTYLVYVTVVNIDSGKSLSIDELVRKKYKKEARPDDRLGIVPIGRAFSPRDKKVLIEMDLGYIFTTGAYEAEQVAKLYKKWWYVVDPFTGKILYVYRSSKIPRRWWKF